MINHDIDFSRAAELMDCVQKQASVVPQYMAISSLALMELKEMNDEAQGVLSDLGQQRLKAEQDAAAKLNADAQAAAEAQARIDAKQPPQPETPAQPLTVMPGEPVPEPVQEEANAEGGIMSQGAKPAPVIRRTAAPDLNDASKQGSG